MKLRQTIKTPPKTTNRLFRGAILRENTKEQHR